MGGTVSLYDVLKARKTGLSPDLYTLLRARQEMPERVITAEPPIYFKSDGTAISEYQISGNIVQNGTPTPDNPVEILGVGDRTANLMFSDSTEKYTSPNIEIYQTKGSAEFTISRTATESDGATTANMLLFLKAGTYTLSVDGMSVFERNLDRITLRDTDGNVLVNKVQTGIPQTFTLTKDALVNKLSFFFAARSTYSNQIVRIMLNSGSTALPYEPYGYKIPITLNSVTQNIYLDSLLYEGDYIKRNADGTGVLHQDGADTPITLPQLSAVKGNNELNISTTVTPEVTLKGKIKQLPDSDMNALLSVMEAM